MSKWLTAVLTGAVLALGAPATGALAQGGKPNILVIFGDDIGWFNTSAYNGGVMGYQTPNIDSIARDGAKFSDWYAQQSCTAGRAAFITGQSPIRTGLTKVGLPGSDVGLQASDPTIAQFLKPLGYATGQFGKNHLGDLNKFLPTVHGFDEFFGNLYHLNAEEEPENPDYPRNPEFRKRFGPRGVLHTWATDTVDATVDPRWGEVGKQRIEDTGPLTVERMETVDNEFLSAAFDFMDAAHKDDKPFFVWFNATRMHIWTHLKPESRGRTGLGIYPDGMVEFDDMVGELLGKLDELGVADNTIVIWTTDNGAEVFSWPDGGTTPFRSEKATNWEGAVRVPMMIRWPGVVKPGSVLNGIASHEDLLETLVAAAGEPGIAEQCKTGCTAGDQTFKVHLDGYDLQPWLKGDIAESPRKEFLYWNDDGQLVALRYDQWKLVFQEQRSEGFDVWQDPYTSLRLPKLFNLRSDPFETADRESIDYARWRIDRAFLFVPAQEFVAQWLQSFREFPPSQIPATFSLDAVMKRLSEAVNQ